MPSSNAFPVKKSFNASFSLAGLAGLTLLAACAPLALFGSNRGARGGGIFRDGCSPALLADAENTAPAAGSRILTQARKMTVENREILPGDWLYFINHSYHGMEHSSLFVAWKDKGAMLAYMLSYPGEQRRETARYLIYDLSNVYQVIRPKG